MLIGDIFCEDTPWWYILQGYSSSMLWYFSFFYYFRWYYDISSGVLCHGILCKGYFMWLCCSAWSQFQSKTKILVFIKANTELTFNNPQPNHTPTHHHYHLTISSPRRVLFMLELLVTMMFLLLASLLVVLCQLCCVVPDFVFILTAVLCQLSHTRCVVLVV